MRDATQMVQAAMMCVDIAEKQAKLNLQVAQTPTQVEVAEGLKSIVESQNEIIAQLVENYLTLGEMYDTLTSKIRSIMRNSVQETQPIVRPPTTEGEH